MPWQGCALTQKPNFCVLQWESRDYILGKYKRSCFKKKPTQQDKGKVKTMHVQLIYFCCSTVCFLWWFNDTCNLRTSYRQFKAKSCVRLNKSRYISSLSLYNRLIRSCKWSLESVKVMDCIILTACRHHKSYSRSNTTLICKCEYAGRQIKQNITCRQQHRDSPSFWQICLAEASCSIGYHVRIT